MATRRLRNEDSVANMPSRRAFCSALAIAATAIMTAGTAAAATFPSKQIRIVVPLPPGGAVDIVARLIQPHLEKALGQTVIIEHRPGASGIIGANAVARAEPDGHTFLIAPTTFTINAAVRNNQPALKTLEPVALVGRNSLLFLVHPSVEAKNLKELQALAKAKPMSLTYSSTGLASQAHLLLQQWSDLAGVKIKHVPYPGGSPAVLAVVRGEAHITLISPTLSLPNVRAGELRVLASGGAKREAELPDVQTPAEAGFPEFKALQWIGLFAPGGTPAPAIERMNSEVRKVVDRPDVVTALAKLGMTPGGESVAEFNSFIASEIKQWAKIAKDAEIKVE